MVRKKPKHGTRSRYVSGCDCARCKKANRGYQREYMAQYRAAKKQEAEEKKT